MSSTSLQCPTSWGSPAAFGKPGWGFICWSKESCFIRFQARRCSWNKDYQTANNSGTLSSLVFLCSSWIHRRSPTLFSTLRLSHVTSIFAHQALPGWWKPQTCMQSAVPCGRFMRGSPQMWLPDMGGAVARVHMFWCILMLSSCK